MQDKVRGLGLALLGAVSILAPSTAVAQEQVGGFSLNRYEPSERGSEWFSAESLDLRGHQRFAAGLTIDYGREPLVIKDENGDEQAALVSDQLFGHLGGAIVLWDRARFSLSLPVVMFQDGEAGTIGTTNVSSDNNPGVGDLRAAADVRIFGEYRDVATLAGGVRIYAPTGSQENFTGDGSFRGAVRATFAGQVSWFAYAASLGFDLRLQDDAFAGQERGSELPFNAAVGASLLDDKLLIGPEVYGATVAKDFFGRTSTPLEVIVGGGYWISDEWRVGAGVGPGLTPGFGTPLVRALASVTWFQPHEEEQPPPPPPPDRDGDGIIDAEDACPDEPGLSSADPEKHGCPPPPDRDEDGILDAEDACPDQPGEPNEDPEKNGCPPPGDRDGDGIVDPVDACPDEPGIESEDPKLHGCPDPDRDKDQILNDQDACPDDPGEANEDPKKHGCPLARVDKGSIVIREQVQFAYNSDRILRASDTVLEAVKKIMTDHPEIKKVSIEGHTDDKGSAAYNKRLSTRRAAAVVKWLKKQGIDAERLTSVGYGEERPIADNKTEEGRAENRRVEIHIVEQEGAKPEAAGATDEAGDNQGSAPATGGAASKDGGSN